MKTNAKKQASPLLGAKIEKCRTMHYLFSHLDVELLDGGYACLDCNWRERDVRSPYSRLYYILSGEGILEDGEGKTLTMLPGHLYFVPSGMLFHYRCEGVLEKLYFHITLRGADRYDILADCNGFFEMPSAEAGDGSLLALYRSEEGADVLSFSSIIRRDVAACLREMQTKRDGGREYSPLVRHAIGYIDSHLSNRLTTEEIAREYYVSPSCLASHFKREVGISIGRYIDDMVAYRARKLLLRDDLSIGDISAKLGFCDQFYFARKFRRIHGETPGAFRRRQRNLT